ncbi:MAG TPA: hypothetical protein ENK70_07485 [Methylophaga sp.]|nr:hypothetical protein [Methylophaga sp.]
MEVGFFAGLLAAFAFGTIWFYVACVITFFGIMALAENEHELLSIGVLIGFIVLMQNSGAFDIFNNPWMVAKWSLIYFVVGTVWSFVKWWAYLTKRAETYGELKDKFNERMTERYNRDDVRPDAIKPITGTATKPSDEFAKFLNKECFLSDYVIRNRTVIPAAMDFKAMITGWIIWWPTSVLWTIVSDPMVRIANWIFARLKGTYQLIANRVFAKFEEA